MSETKCAEKICGEHAAFRYTWPGRAEAFACVDHALQIAGVARGIGMPLQLIPLAYRVGEAPAEWPTCTQRQPERASEEGKS